MEARFAHHSVPWLTPERSQRIERKLERLRQAETQRSREQAEA
jgi:hypothetical protein